MFVFITNIDIEKIYSEYKGVLVLSSLFFCCGHKYGGTWSAGTAIPVTSFCMAYIGRRTHFPCICMLASSHDKKFFSTSNRGPRDTARAMCYSRSPTHFMNATTQDEVVCISDQKFIQYRIRLIRQRHQTTYFQNRPLRCSATVAIVLDVQEPAARWQVAHTCTNRYMKKKMKKKKKRKKKIHLSLCLT